MIDVEHLSKSYGPRPALVDLNLHVSAGGVVGLLGVNGAGKTTLMRILTGFLTPTAGRARVCGYDVEADPLAVKRRVGYLPETTPLHPELRVTEFLAYRARLKGLARSAARDAVARAIDRAGLREVADRIIGQLSRGYRQRTGLAECLLVDAPLLVLDEPTAGLDPHQARETRALVTELGRDHTVLLSTHILHDAELMCQEVVIIHEGRLVAVDSPQALCARRPGPRALLVAVGAPQGARVAEALTGLSGVRAADEVAGTDEARRWRLSVDRTEQARQAVPGLCAQQGWTLCELRLEPVRLEDIFADLTAASQREGVS